MANVGGRGRRKGEGWKGSRMEIKKLALKGWCSDKGYEWFLTGTPHFIGEAAMSMHGV